VYDDDRLSRCRYRGPRHGSGAAWSAAAWLPDRPAGVYCVRACRLADALACAFRPAATS